MNPLTKQGLRLVVDRDRGVELFDLALVHDGDAVGDAHRLVLVVRHENGGETERPLQALDLDLHVETQVAVEGGEGLVEQQDRGLDGERPRERHPLLLAARELARQAILEAPELDRLEEARDPCLDLGATDTAGAQAVGHVLRHRHVREEGVVLEDDADVALVGRQVVDDGAVDAHATGRLAHEARDDAEEGGLAAARGAEQGHDLTGLDGERDAVDGGRRSVADRQVLDIQRARRGDLHCLLQLFRLPFSANARGMPAPFRADSGRELLAPRPRDGIAPRDPPFSP